MRFRELDLIRGALVLYVVFYHMSLAYGYILFDSSDRPAFYFIMSFFMVPFYFFSGFLFSSKRNTMSYIRNKFKKLVLPYVFWGGDFIGHILSL